MLRCLWGLKFCSSGIIELWDLNLIIGILYLPTWQLTPGQRVMPRLGFLRIQEIPCLISHGEAGKAPSPSVKGEERACSMPP